MKEAKGFAFLRIAFGLVWAFDAVLKWQPAFLNDFAGQVGAMLEGQPAWMAAWIEGWVHLANMSPHLFAILIAILQTGIALGLILGLFTRTTIIIGILMSLVIWAVPEGFGGPYGAGSTDPGAAIIYLFVFVALWLGASWSMYSIDSRLSRDPAHSESV
jgi:thiosulfate dehydrogenase (quinone) large subunit